MDAPLIRLEAVAKRFGGAVALADVTCEMARGEIHAVVGENGAGKSTLMKLLAGVHAPDAGRILLRGQPARLASPLAARRHGIRIVFQELSLFPHLSVTANLFLQDERSRRGLLDFGAMEEGTREALRLMGVEVEPRARVGRLPVGERQLVEIARALRQEAEILLLDEPNSALTGAETERLFALLRRLRARGITILYVSHRLEEVFAVADRITVLRDGRWQGTWPTVETTIPDVIAAMIGRPLEETFPERGAPVSPDAPVALSAAGLRKEPALGPVSFELRRGEILGLAGLEGAGVETLFALLFGLERPGGGQIHAGGRPLSLRSPGEALRQGWGLIPASRRDQGLMMEWSIERNATLLILDRLLHRLGLIDRQATRRTAAEYVRRLRIAADGLDRRVAHLSGGNQQKVLLSRWLATGPSLLLLNNPTRGVDVGAKYEIYQLCSQLAAQGMAILFTSSEIEEILGLCDRTLVLYKGRVVREFARGSATKAEVLRWMSGGPADAGSTSSPHAPGGR